MLLKLINPIFFKCTIFFIIFGIKTQSTGIQLRKYPESYYLLPHFIRLNRFFLIHKKDLDTRIRKYVNLFLKCTQSNNIQFGNIKTVYSDPDINQQWYFMRSSLSKNSTSHDLDKIWNNGITGYGIVLGIVGGGVEVDHRDLRKNFNANISYNFVYQNSIINPSHNGIPTHFAGLISAVGNNDICGVGAAPSSQFSNLQIMDDYNNNLIDAILAQALLHMNDKIDIYLINYSLDYRVEINETIGLYIIRALANGIKFGRKGLGSIYITFSGDKKTFGNNCAYNGIIQRPEILTFGVYNDVRGYPEYLEQCTAVLAATIGTHYINGDDQLYTTASQNQCGNSASGSSASAAIGAGILALLISHNPSLTVRQIMILIILTSEQWDPNAIKNAADHFYSYYYGFGLINAEKLILFSHSEDIKNLKPQHICYTYSFYLKHNIVRRKTYKLFIYSSGCLISSYCVTKIEQVYIAFSLNIQKRNTLKLFLTSPSGTRLNILLPRIFDESNEGFNRWRIKILGYFGEQVSGLWIFEIVTLQKKVTFTYIELIFYGECIDSNTNLQKHKVIMSKLLGITNSKLKKNKLLWLNSLMNQSFTFPQGTDYSSLSNEEFPEVKLIRSDS